MVSLLPSEAVKGWFLFTRICQLACKWNLCESDVVELEGKIVAFFEHFRDYYFNLRDERVQLCRYVIHELLHLPDAIRDCGPICLLAQWNTENYIGSITRRCNAKSNFGESLSVNIVFKQALRMFCLNRSVDVKYITKEKQLDHSIEFVSPSNNSTDGRSFLFPTRWKTLSELSEQLGINARNLLVSYFVREGLMGRAEANRHLTSDFEV